MFHGFTFAIFQFSDCLRRILHKVMKWHSYGKGTGKIIERLRPVPLFDRLSRYLKLKHYLQRKLNFPHRHLCWLIDQTEAADRSWVKRDQVVRRRREVRAIENIEQLRWDLDIEIFPDFFVGVVF